MGLHDLNHSGNTVFGRETDHQMNMIRLNMSLTVLDIGIVLPDLIQPDHQVLSHPTHQNFVSIPRNPNNVVHAPVYTVGLSSQFHALSIPLSPKKTWEPDTPPGLTSGDLLRSIRAFANI